MKLEVGKYYRRTDFWLPKRYAYEMVKVVSISNKQIDCLIVNRDYLVRYVIDKDEVDESIVSKLVECTNLEVELYTIDKDDNT